jgi:hypothetical protein
MSITETKPASQQPIIQRMEHESDWIAFPAPSEPFQVSSDIIEEFKLRSPFLFRQVDYDVASDSYTCVLTTPDKVDPGKMYEMKHPLYVQIRLMKYDQDVAKIEIEELKNRIKALESKQPA